MPQGDDAPKTPKELKPYTFHKVYFHEKKEDEWNGTCPFCGKEKKFGVNVESGKFKCLRCQATGNSSSFLQRLADESPAGPNEIEALREDRTLLFASTLMEWGVKISMSSMDPIFPAYNEKGAMCQIYRYCQFTGEDKPSLKPTSEKGIGLFGQHLMRGKQVVYICESWNAPILWEILKYSKLDIGEGGLVFTDKDKGTLLDYADVLGMSGASSWKAAWNKLVAGKDVIFIPDNDHEYSSPSGKVTTGAGLAGVKQIAASMMNGAKADKPKSISMLFWDDAGWTKVLKSGYDLRDHLSDPDPQARIAKWEETVPLIKPLPADWISEEKKATKERESLHSRECTSWDELLKTWRHAMEWTPDLEYMLASLLTCVASTDTRGEQIWVLGMAPPSSGKTTLCEAIAVSKKYTISKSELTRMYSGYKMDKEGDEDFSLVAQLDGKTLIIMDCDPILKDPNRAKILAQLRGLYDGVGRSHFNNGMSRDYEPRFTLILMGTASMRELDASEVGARFVNVSFDKTSHEHEQTVARRVFWRSIRDRKEMANGGQSTRVNSDMKNAKELTGGYVDYLRENIESLVAKVEIDEETDAGTEQKIMAYGEFIACLRARPPKFQDEVTERELCPRLVAQLSGVALTMAAVLNKTRIDDEVLGYVRRMAEDTARGKTLNLALILRGMPEGASTKALSVALTEPEEKVKTLLEFLAKIEVVERFDSKKTQYMTGQKKWRLTERLQYLLNEVYGYAEGEHGEEEDYGEHGVG